MTAITHVVPAAEVLLNALEAEEHARDAAGEVRDRLTRAQSAGVDPLPPGAEFLLSEADARHQELMALLGSPARRDQVVTTSWSDWGRSRGVA